MIACPLSDIFALHLVRKAYTASDNFIPGAKLGSSPGFGGSGIPKTLKRPIAAVMRAKGIVAVASKLTFSGTGNVVDAGATVYSWYAPY